MRRFVPALLAALLVSCSSARMAVAPVTVAEVQLRDVRKTLEAGDFLRALQDITYLDRAGVSDLSPLRAQALEELRGSLADAVERNAYAEAYRLYLSVVALGEDPGIQGLALTDLVLSVVEERVEKRDLVSALLYLRRAGAALDLPEDRTRRIVETLQAAGLPAGEAPGATQAAVLTEDMLRGTVTVWVDKGIKIEGGIGYADRAMGSGFFVDPRGYLLTNHHVIQSEVDPKYEGYSRLYVRLPGRSEERIPAKVVSWDKVFDLALLKVEVAPAYTFPIFNQPKVLPGQKVLAIGSPVDPFLSSTITSGIVSAIGRRRFLQMGDVIQIDAAVNPGNSGGPLVNEAGQLVGIVFAGIKPFEGLNFAIPATWVAKVYPTLAAAAGEIRHPWLGMALVDTESRLEVVYAVPGEPADRGGIEEGDILLRVNGREFSSVVTLQEALLDLPPATLVRLEWGRGEQVHTGVFLLGSRPESPLEKALEVDSRLNVLLPLFGMKLKRASNFLWETEYVTERVLPGSVADNTGISTGDAVNLQNWRVDAENRYALLQIFVKKRKSGYLERVVQLAAYLDSDNFI